MTRSESPGPLGGHKRFAHSTDPREWSGGTANFGSAIDGFVQGINDFAALPRPSGDRNWAGAYAIGCVPWMNHPEVVTALAGMDGCCVVLTKNTDLRSARVLQQTGKPILSGYLRWFDEVGLLNEDGTPPTIGPYGMTPATIVELGPVRLAGYRGSKNLPLLHAKLLVLGDAIGYENDETLGLHRLVAAVVLR
jgi:hypothetical protein